MPLNNPSIIDLSNIPNGYRVGGISHFYQATKPTALASGDRWVRTTDGTLWTWKPTIATPSGGNLAAWVSDSLLSIHFEVTNAATTGNPGRDVVIYPTNPGLTDILLSRMVLSIRAVTATSNTNYWSVGLGKNSPTGETYLGLTDYQTLPANTNQRIQYVNNLQVDELTNPSNYYYLRHVRVGTPGNLFCGLTAFYRWIYP